MLQKSHPIQQKHEKKTIYYYYYYPADINYLSLIVLCCKMHFSDTNKQNELQNTEIYRCMKEN